MMGLCRECKRQKVVIHYPKHRARLAFVCHACYWKLRKQEEREAAMNMSAAVIRVYDKILWFVDHNGRCPSARELCKIMHWKSPRSATFVYKKIAAAGKAEKRGRRWWLVGQKFKGQQTTEQEPKETSDGMAD
jgi:hypothetical protein